MKEKKKKDFSEGIREEYLMAFYAWMKASDYSQGTMDKYLRDLRKCAAWLGRRVPDQKNLVAFKGYLIEEGLKPATVNGKLSAINTFCKFAGIPVRLNFLRIQKRLFRDECKELTQKDYEQLVRTAMGNGNERLALIMETICSTGIRISELKYVTVDAVRLGMTQIRLKGKVREIILPVKLCVRLRKYIKKEKITSGEVFLNQRGKGISRKQVWDEMKDLADAAGVDPEKVFPHNLRRLFARVFYQVTHDLVKLSNILGHSNINTTRIYLQMSVREHLSDLEKTGLVLNL